MRTFAWLLLSPGRATYQLLSVLLVSLGTNVLTIAYFETPPSPGRADYGFVLLIAGALLFIVGAKVDWLYLDARERVLRGQENLGLRENAVSMLSDDEWWKQTFYYAAVLVALVLLVLCVLIVLSSARVQNEEGASGFPSTSGRASAPLRTLGRARSTPVGRVATSTPASTAKSR